MADNAQMDFEISNEDMETLKNAEKIKNYGDFSLFPIFGGKMAADGSCTPGMISRTKSKEDIGNEKAVRISCQ